MRGGAAALGTHSFRHLAIADPRTAPYGAAAKEILERRRVWDTLQTQIVRGANVGQVFQFVESSAAELGFVALSQIMRSEPRHYRVVPQELHSVIRQDAVLLQHGALNPAARRFLEFLQSEAGGRLMAEFGYTPP